MFKQKTFQREQRNEKLNVCCFFFGWALKVIDFTSPGGEETTMGKISQQMSMRQIFQRAKKLIYLFKYPIRCSLWNQWTETEIGIINKREIIHFRSKSFFAFSLYLKWMPVKWNECSICELWYRPSMRLNAIRDPADGDENKLKPDEKQINWVEYFLCSNKFNNDDDDVIVDVFFAYRDAFSHALLIKSIFY